MLLTFASNIGNNAKALWEHYDDSVDDQFLISRQQMHVSILSTFSFLGRLGSGKSYVSFCLDISAKVTNIYARCRVRHSCEEAQRQPGLVSSICLLHLFHCSDLRPQHIRTSLAGFRLWLIWTWVRISLWCVPFYCCRDVWYQRSQPELGFHDTRSSAVIQCF